MNIYEKIDNVFSSLSKGHKKVAVYLQRHKADVLALTAKELAEQIDVSETMVIRFARVVGFSTYKELQQAIKKDSITKSSVMKVYDELLEEHSFEGLDYIGIVKKDIDNVNRTLKGLDVDVLYNLVERILHARRIGVIGSRGELTPAIYLNHYIYELFTNSTLLYPGIGDSHDRMRDWGEEDLIIAFAFWDDSFFEKSLLKYAKNKGSYIIAITKEEAIKIQALADKSILVETHGVFPSYTASVALVNIILDLVTRQLPQDKILKAFQSIDEVLKSMYDPELD